MRCAAAVEANGKSGFNVKVDVAPRWLLSVREPNSHTCTKQAAGRLSNYFNFVISQAHEFILRALLPPPKSDRLLERGIHATAVGFCTQTGEFPVARS